MDLIRRIQELYYKEREINRKILGNKLGDIIEVEIREREINVFITRRDLNQQIVFVWMFQNLWYNMLEAQWKETLMNKITDNRIAIRW